MKRNMTLQLIREGKIWCYKEKIIVTDPSYSTRKDAVFPLCYENTYFVEHLATKERYTVLDLCTGSGILALFAAEKTRKVYAIDINKRALYFAKLNAGLNNVNNIEFLEGDLFEPVKEMKFDLIIANPPFEPIPDSIDYPLHSNGGEKCTKVLERILSEINDYVASNGSFQIISWIPESKKYILDQFDKSHYNDFNTEILQTYSSQQIRKYLQKRLRRKIRFDEPISLCFIQAFKFLNPIKALIS